MIVDVSKIQQIMIILILAAVIVAGVQCSNHEVTERVSHDDGNTRIKAQSRISMLKNGYGARVQIREDLHGRKHAHAMAICDCNGQGPWRPLFKPSQILKTEFPEHESFHDDVDVRYRGMVDDHVDNNHLRSSPSSEHSAVGLDGSDSSVGVVGGLMKKHNHMIHLHLIPHIYVPVVHSSAGYAEVKNYQTAAEDGQPPAPPVQHSESSPEFHGGDGTGPAGLSGQGENAAADHDHGNVINGHSGETSYYTITDDAVQQHNQDVHENFGNAIDNNGNHNHDYEVPSSSIPDEPHQYQVHENEDLSKDFSSKKHVMSMSSAATSTLSKPHQPKHRKTTATVATMPNRAKHGRKLSSRQDLKNLLVMRPPPVGQSQTWRYVYRQPIVARHQFYHQPMRKSPPQLMAALKTRTMPLILHIRQRSDNND